MKLIFETMVFNDKFTKVYWNKDTEEFVVKWYQYRKLKYGLHAVNMDASDYFTQDRDDAMETATYWIEEEIKASNDNG